MWGRLIYGIQLYTGKYGSFTKRMMKDKMWFSELVPSLTSKMQGSHDEQQQ